MSDGLSLNWSKTQADAKRSHFRRVIATYLVIQAIAGVLGIFFAGAIADLLASPAGLVRASGGLMLLVAILSTPAFTNPARSKLTTLVVLIGGVLLGLLWLFAGHGFVWIGIVQIAYMAGLLMLVCRYFMAELASRP